MAENKITRDKIADSGIFEIGVDYAKSLQPAIDANKKWLDSFPALKKAALEYDQISKSFGKATGQADFVKTKKKEAETTEQVTVALKEQQSAELNLIKTIERKSLVTESTVKTLIKERFELAQLNKAAKDEAILNSESSTSIQKLEVLRKRQIKTIQEYQARLALGQSLSDSEQKELEEYTKTLTKERFELEQLNKTKKDEAILNSKSSTLIQKLEVLRKRQIKTIQDYQARLSLGQSLSDREQKELNESTIAYNRYNNAIRTAKNSTGQFQENVGNYPRFLGAAKQGVSSFIGAAKGLVPVLGVAAGLSAAFDLVKESIQIAAEAKGVEFAYEKIGSAGVEAFDKIKASTRGLLSDLDIKKSIVEFDNFNLSLDESATLFEFLSVRAAQSGKSVDSLKDSLVEGLSKESKLRIDNLGISATELNAELSKTPDFVQAVANIAKREVAEAGNILDGASNSQEKWNANLENFQVSVGRGGFSAFADVFLNIGSSILKAITPTKTLTKGIIEQQTELLGLENQLFSTNLKEEERVGIILKLKAEYPKLLKNLNAETASNEDLRVALKSVNEQLINRIIIARKQDELNAQNEDTATEVTRLIDAKQRLRDFIGRARRIDTKFIPDSSLSEIENARILVQRLNTISQEKGGESRRVYVGLGAAIGNVVQRQGFLNKEQAKSNAILSEREALLKELGISLDEVLGNGGEVDPNKTKELTEEEIKAAKKLAEERKKAAEAARKEAERLAQEKRKAIFELNKFEIEDRRNTYEILRDDEDESFAVRFEAQKAVSNASIELEKLTADFRLTEIKKFTQEELAELLSSSEVQLANRKDLSEQQLLIVKEYQSNLRKLKKENEDQEDNLELDRIKREAETATNIRNTAADNEIRAVEEAFQNRTDLEENYKQANEDRERAIAAIKRKYALEALNVQLGALETLLASSELSAEKRIEYEAQVADFKRQIAEINSDAFIAANEAQLESERLKAEEILEIGRDIANAILSLTDAIFEGKIQKIEEEQQASAENYDRQLEYAEGDAAQTRLLEEQKEKARLKLEDKKRKEQRKQAILNKAFAAVEIGVQTSIAIIKAVAASPLTGGLPFSAIAAGLGALQLAAVLARPIPQYATGTEDHPGGYALVGEVRPEVIREPGRDPYIVSKPTILDLPRHSKVTKSVGEFNMMMRELEMQNFKKEAQNIVFLESSKNTTDDRLFSEMVKIRKAAENQKSPIVNTQKQDINYAVYRLNIIKWD